MSELTEIFLQQAFVEECLEAEEEVGRPLTSYEKNSIYERAKEIYGITRPPQETQKP